MNYLISTSFLILALSLSSCKSTCETATFPNQKVDTVGILTVSGDSFNGLKISNYQSAIDTSLATPTCNAAEADEKGRFGLTRARLVKKFERPCFVAAKAVEWPSITHWRLPSPQNKVCGNCELRIPTASVAIGRTETIGAMRLWRASTNK